MSVTLSKFNGINNRAIENRLPEGALRECVDFNIDDGGILSHRDGYTLKINGEFTSLWSDSLCCFAANAGIY